VRKTYGVFHGPQLAGLREQWRPLADGTEWIPGRRMLRTRDAAAYTGLTKSISFRRGIAALRISESLGLTVCSDNDEGIDLGATMS
jgi:hypothetical protein